MKFILKNKIPIILFSSICLLAYSLLAEANVIFALTLSIWTGMFMYALLNIKKNVALFCFLITFFLFLLGRETVFALFNVPRYYIYSEEIDNKTYFILLISLLMAAIGIWISDKIFLNGKDKPILVYSKSYPTIAKYFFYISCAAAIIRTAQKAILVAAVGYVESYQSGIGLQNSFLVYFASFCDVALCLYLACSPSKRETKKVILLYELYLVLTLFTGLRSVIMVGNLFIIMYVIIRHVRDGDWIKKEHIAVFCLLIPITAVFLYVFDFLRSGRAFEFDGLFKTLISFLDQQGGSVNNIKRVMYYHDQIKDLNLVSFSGMNDNLFKNFIMRTFFEVKTYSGNSVEHALEGNSLAHRLSYYVYGIGYLNGKGTGSSYIAELYHDFGLIGVCAGNILYGILLKKISDVKLDNRLTSGFLLLFFFSIIYAPRSNFDGFLSSVISIRTIIGIVMIFIIAQFYDKNISQERL